MLSSRLILLLVTPERLLVGVQLFNELVDKFGHALRVGFVRYQLAELSPLFFFFLDRCHGGN
jgi:hypothetical protein